MARRIGLSFIVLVALLGRADAAEYSVTKRGNDANDGLSRERAFLTIQKGVDALQPGDTLTIGPGEYFESVRRDNLGDAEKETVIRAQIPGTVLLRGDEPAPEFRKAPGYRFVYAADFPQAVQAVNEVDTLRILASVPNAGELEFNPGGFHYDSETQTLYMSPSDLQPPDKHFYTISALDGRAGIYLVKPERVVLDGLAATGFHRAVALPRLRGGRSSSDRIPHGFYLWRSKRSVIRSCRAFLNAGGISILSDSGGGNVIEACTAYANQSKHGISAGNIVVFSFEDDKIRDSHSYKGQHHGIRMYGGGQNPAGLLQNNLSWGNRGADFQIKGGALAAEQSKVQRCLAPLGSITARDVRNSLIGRRDDSAGDNIILEAEADIDLNLEFADTKNLDYHLQSTSRFRGASVDRPDRGPFPYQKNIFYLSPNGDDSADGLSVATAWRSLPRALTALRPGDTLYLKGGRYAASGALTARGEAAAPVCIRGRGREPAVIAGPFSVRESSVVSFARLNFADGIAVGNSRDVRFENCRFSGETVSLAAQSVQGLRVTHSEFSGFRRSALDLRGTADVFLQGNVFDNRNGFAIRTDRPGAVLYSDYNSYRNADSAWEVRGAALDFQEIQRGHTGGRLPREGLSGHPWEFTTSWPRSEIACGWPGRSFTRSPTRPRTSTGGRRGRPSVTSPGEKPGRRRTRPRSRPTGSAVSA